MKNIITRSFSVTHCHIIINARSRGLFDDSSIVDNLATHPTPPHVPYLQHDSIWSLSRFI